jgi:hypothetical protein
MCRPDGDDEVLSCLALKNLLKSFIVMCRGTSWWMIRCKEAIHDHSFSFRLLLSQSCSRKVPSSRESMWCGLDMLTADERAGLAMKGVLSDCRECLQFLFIILFSMSSLEVRVMRLLLSDDSSMMSTWVKDVGCFPSISLLLL